MRRHFQLHSAHSESWGGGLEGRIGREYHKGEKGRLVGFQPELTMREKGQMELNRMIIGQ